MTPKQFGNLPTTPAGLPIVKLMEDPDLTGAEAFLSLVDKGANGRRVQVRKAADQELEVVADLGQVPSEEASKGVLAKIAGALGIGGWFAQVSKGDGPETFEAAIGVPKLWEALWNGEDALRAVVRNVLEDEDKGPADKRTLIAAALDGFKAYVLAEVDGTVALASKSEDLQAVALAASRLEDPRGVAIKVSKIADVGAISAVLTGLITEIGDRDATDRAAKGVTLGVPTPEGDHVKLESIKALADAASEQAIKSYRDAGITDASQLAQVGSAASAEVFKAAVAGAPQASIPANLLKDQITEAGGTQGKAGDPLAQVMGALGQIKGLATKIDALEQAINGKGEGADAEPGLMALASKALELSTKTAGVVSKIAGTPAPSVAGGGHEPTPDPKRELARKAEAEADGAFKGTALGGFTEGKAAGQ
jgi:hypothetical protein